MSKPKSGLFSGTKGSKIKLGETNDTNQDDPNIVNKRHHIFHNEEHNLDKFLESFNYDERTAYNELEKAYNNYIRKNEIKDGFLKIKVNINGFEITIRGTVIDGVGHIGTSYIEE